MPLACANAVAGSATAHIHANTTPHASLRIAPPGCRLPQEPGIRDRIRERRCASGYGKERIRGVENTPTPIERQAFAALYCVEFREPRWPSSKMVKWPVVAFGALLLTGGPRAQRQRRSAARLSGSSRHIHQRRRADPLPAVRTVPPARRTCTIQSHHLRRRAPACRADRGGHGEPLYAALEAGTGVWRLLRRTQAVGRPARDHRPLGRRGRLEGKRSDLPVAPRSSSGWQLGAPDLVVTLPEYTLRAGGTDVFRNFVVSVPRSGTRRPRYGISARQSRRTPRQHSRRPHAGVAAADEVR